MNLTFMNDLGQTFTVEIDSSMELENVMALLEAESGVPVPEQAIHFGDRELNDPKKTMRDYGIPDNTVLILRRRGANVGGRQVEQDAETMRLQLLGNSDLMRQLQEAQPELASAAQSDPARFAELLRHTRDRQMEAELQRQAEIQRLNNDPFDIEAQRKIEEYIRQEAVLENMQNALEWLPESFGRVTMLYVPVEVNSHPVKAFVDSGAQLTIMSPECAEACGIMRLIDRRFSGIAHGAGTANIIGRVHTAHLKIADVFLPCSFTIMEAQNVDLLFGLDMLMAHQACIDLEKKVLRIQGREVKFLSEHELPRKARFSEELPEATAASNPTGYPSGSSIPSNDSGNRSFPGSGQTIGVPPAVVPPNRQTSSTSTSRYPEDAISTLVGLGASREEAIRLLDAADGNVDSAASFLF